MRILLERLYEVVNGEAFEKREIGRCGEHIFPIHYAICGMQVADIVLA